VFIMCLYELLWGKCESSKLVFLFPGACTPRQLVPTR
jgi:hypothetical protein